MAQQSNGSSENLEPKMAFAADQVMRTGLRGSPSWPGNLLFPRPDMLMQTDCSQLQNSPCRRGGPYVRRGQASRLTVVAAVDPTAMEGSAVKATTMNVVTVKKAEPKRKPCRNSVGEERVGVRVV
jgi:hypothetical protein